MLEVESIFSSIIKATKGNDGYHLVDEHLTTLKNDIRHLIDMKSSNTTKFVDIFLREEGQKKRMSIDGKRMNLVLHKFGLLSVPFIAFKNLETMTLHRMYEMNLFAKRSINLLREIDENDAPEALLLDLALNTCYRDILVAKIYHQYVELMNPLFHA